MMTSRTLYLPTYLPYTYDYKVSVSQMSWASEQGGTLVFEFHEYGSSDIKNEMNQVETKANSGDIELLQSIDSVSVSDSNSVSAEM